MSPGSDRVVLTTLAAALTFGASAASGQAARGPAIAPGSGAVRASRDTSFGRLPLAFERNTGRYDKRVEFLTRTGGATIFITQSEMVMVMPGKARGEGQEASGDVTASPAPGGRGLGGGGIANAIAPVPGRAAATRVLRMTLVGANGKSVATGMEKQTGIVNYFIGNDPKMWRTRIPTYARARLSEVYPGIDLVYYGVGGQEASGDVTGSPAPGGRGSRGGGLSRHSPLTTHLEYDFIVKPGADPQRIRLAFEGVDRIRLADGDLILSTPAGDVRLTRPYAYQTIGGKRVQVACDYDLSGRGATLRLARYDASKPLVVDPGLVFSTYLGGSGDDTWPSSIALDAAGASYVTGYTCSADFPTTAGAYDTTYNGVSPRSDVFVTKLNATGAGLVYSTYVGGTDNDAAQSIALDSSGAAYVVGQTFSSDFPTTAGAFDTSFNDTSSATDGFVLKLNAAGSALAYSTFLGGTASDAATGVAVDSSGAAYVVGRTSSSGFPTTSGAFDRTYSGGDAFVAKLNAAGSALSYSTFLGGWSGEEGSAIALGSSGTVHVTGHTSSSDFPTTAGAYDRTINFLHEDAFVVKLNATGSALTYSTFLGGNEDDDYGLGLAVDSTGAAYVTGRTRSSDFPTTTGAYDTALGGAEDAFVAKLNATGSALVYSTYLGGAANDRANGIALDTYRAAYITGATQSADFPTTSVGYDRSHNGGGHYGYDCFVAVLSADGSGLTYGTFLGGSSDDEGDGIAADASGAAYVTGYTVSANFPTTPGAYDATYNGGDLFVAKLTIPAATALSVPDVGSGYYHRQLDLAAVLTSRGVGVSGRSVSFSVAGSAVGNGTTDAAGRATVGYEVPESLPLGPNSIAGSFSGDAEYLPCTGSGTLWVSKADTTLYTIDRTGTITENVILRQYDLKRTTDNALLEGRTISYKIDGTGVGTATTDAGGDSALVWAITEGPGTRTITAEFAGDSVHYGCSHDRALTAEGPWPVKFWAAVGLNNRRITDYTILRAYLWRMDNTGIYKKTVGFAVDGTNVGTAPTNVQGRAQLYHVIFDGAGSGPRTVQATWAGDGGYQGKTGAATLTVLKAIPYIWVLPKTIPHGAIANLYAYFRRLYDYQKQAGKTVDFKIDGTVVQTVVTDANGVARHLYPTTEPVGVHTIRCEFYGDAWLEAGYGEGSLTIY